MNDIFFWETNFSLILDKKEKARQFVKCFPHKMQESPPGYNALLYSSSYEFFLYIK